MEKNEFEKGLVKWIVVGLLIFDFAFFRSKGHDNNLPVELKLIGLLVLDIQILIVLFAGLSIIWLLHIQKIHRSIFPRR